MEKWRNQTTVVAQAGFYTVGVVERGAKCMTPDFYWDKLLDTLKTNIKNRNKDRCIDYPQNTISTSFRSSRIIFSFHL